MRNVSCVGFFCRRNDEQEKPNDLIAQPERRVLRGRPNHGPSCCSCEAGRCTHEGRITSSFNIFLKYVNINFNLFFFRKMPKFELSYCKRLLLFSDLCSEISAMYPDQLCEGKSKYSRKTTKNITVLSRRTNSQPTFWPSQMEQYKIMGIPPSLIYTPPQGV